MPAEVTLAQAALESGWARSPIGGYNIFGIKGSGPAGKTSVNTKEYLDGRWVSIKDGFAKYHNFAQAVEKHGANQLYTRLNVSGQTRRSELEDILRGHKLVMNPPLPEEPSEEPASQDEHVVAAGRHARGLPRHVHGNGGSGGRRHADAHLVAVERQPDSPMALVGQDEGEGVDLGGQLRVEVQHAVADLQAGVAAGDQVDGARHRPQMDAFRGGAALHVGDVGAQRFHEELP